MLGLEEADDGWDATGVPHPERFVQDLHNQMRDPGKISFPVAGNDDIWIEPVGDVELVIVRVRIAPRRHRPVFLNGRRDHAFVRRGQRDSRCSGDELDRMRSDATPIRYDQTIYPYMGIDDFDLDAVERYRAMSQEQKPGLAHHRKTLEEFLRLAEAWRVDRELGTEGPTLAGILMFGNDDAIRQIRPNHVIDYRRAPIGGPAAGERWADRVRWRGHLFGAWEEIFPRLVRGLPVPFRLRGPHRQDEPAGLSALREAFVNLLVHTDYQETSDAVILHRDDGYLFRNPGDSWVDIRDLGVQGRSERRNPIIAQLFDNIGLAEQAGSGYVTILEEWQELGYRKPRVVSDSSRYEFELDLTLAQMISADDRRWLAEIGGLWKPDEELTLVFARHQGQVDNQTLRGATNQDVLATSQTLRSLRDRNYLVLHGNGRNAYYLLGPSSSPDHLPENADHLDPTRDQTLITSQLHKVADPIAQSGKVSPDELKSAIVTLCRITPLSQADLAQFLGRSRVTIGRHTSDLLKTGLLLQEHEQASHPKQRYLAVVRGPEKSIQTELDL